MRGQPRVHAYYLSMAQILNIENNKGNTPFLVVAFEAGHHEMAEVLWGLGTMLS
jgi:hypothetical protein